MTTGAATKKPRVMSGMRSTGALHLGHLVGVLSQWVAFCDSADSYFEIADIHAYTTGFMEPDLIRDSRIAMVAVWLAAGVDPKKATIFLQSGVPQITELQAYLAMITPNSWLERVPTYKGQIEALGHEIDTYGFLGYPLLQTCDVAIVRGERVPVGRDQVAHLELSREIIRRFNHIYGKGEAVLVEAQATITEFAEIPGIDGRKMSKSYNNAIDIADDEETTTKRVRAMLTDPQKVRRGDPGNPDICPVYALWKFADPARVAAVATGCRSGELGCAADKADLAEALNAYLRPIRERYHTFMSDPSQVERIIEEGTAKTRDIASEVMADVKRAMKLT